MSIGIQLPGDGLLSCEPVKCSQRRGEGEGGEMEGNPRTQYAAEFTVRLTAQHQLAPVANSTCNTAC